jgi:hypothetical protein
MLLVYSPTYCSPAFAYTARMRVGYGRVSTRDQNPDGQSDALAAAGCDEILVDKAIGLER